MAKKTCWRCKILRLFFIVLIITFASILYQSWQHSFLLPLQSSYLLFDRKQQFLAQIPAKNHTHKGYGYWELPFLPQRIVSATIALEDQRFWEHFGVDITAIFRALWNNLQGHSRQGASTLAMQLVRLQYPQQRNYWNKVNEAFSAVLMTWRYGKKAILQQYLQRVSYGNQYHGIVYASRLYFNKPIKDLSWAEIALLSAIPKAPSRMNLYTVSGLIKAKKRAQRILQYLYQEKILTRAYYLAAKDELQLFHVLSAPQRPEIALHAILQLKKKLYKYSPKQYLLRTTLDLSLQQAIVKKLHLLLSDWQQYAVDNVAIILSDTQTGAILAWIGSIDYFHSPSGAIDFTQVYRSSGSTLKPFIYAQALEKKIIHVNSLLADTKKVSKGVRNADKRFLGLLLPRQALANSRNVPAINLLEKVGIDNIYYFLYQLQLHSYQHSSAFYGLGMAIGGLAVNLEKLLQAYSIFNNDGRYIPFTWFDATLKIPPSSTTLLSAVNARQIRLFLADPLARLPTFSRMKNLEFTFPVAIKTGTSQNYRDAWSIAFSQHYSLGIWAGRSDQQPMYQFGGAKTAQLTQYILQLLHVKQQYGYADHLFPPPKQHKSMAICANTGSFQIKNCTGSIFEEWFPNEQLASIKASMLITSSQHTQITSDLLSDFSLNTILSDQQPVSLTITAPANNTRLLYSSQYSSINTIPIYLEVIPQVKQVVWYVDDRVFEVSAFPYVLFWKILKGRHSFQAKLLFQEKYSNRVTIYIE